MVMHIVHLKTLSSLGQRTRDAHVMQFPVAKSLLPDGPPLLCVVLKLCLAGIMPASSVLPSSADGPGVVCLLPLKSDGKGWLMERACCGRRWGSGRLMGGGSSYSESEELESGWMWARALGLEESRRPDSAVGVSRAREWMRLTRSPWPAVGWAPRRRLLQGAISADQMASGRLLLARRWRLHLNAGD